MLGFRRCFLSLLITSLIWPQLAMAASDKPSAGPHPYCLALRGNGELAPAHWGGLAQVVERLGLPSAMAGGSSASISLFLLESIALNPLVQHATNSNRQRENASLLLKSLQSYIEVIAMQPEWREMAALAAFLKQQGGGESMEFMAWLKQMVESQPQNLAQLVLSNLGKIQSSLQLPIEMGLVDPRTFAPLFMALSDLKQATAVDQQQAALARVNFYSGEIYRAISLLGKFDAESDHNLFFRSGLVNFSQLASSFGKVANFYAGREMTSSLLSDLSDFVDLCAALAKKKTWDQLRQSNPQCDQKFKALVNAYKKAELPKDSPDRNLDQVGSFIPTFPTTAVLTGAAYQQTKQATARYHQVMSAEFGKDFQVNPADVRFGYWGQAAELERISKNLKSPFTDKAGRVWDFSQDAKSGLFMALGPATWGYVMSMSPAEPGLAPLQEFKRGTEPLYSAGGWSDLHPGAVLKANGCDNVVYVTRRGGESLFGQGVAKRLLQFPEVPWDDISTRADRKAANVIRNNLGHATDQTSLWSRLYNLANSQSSYNRALKLFDSVLCTDWNRFDIMQEGAISGMINEAYQAPWAFARLDSVMGREAVRQGWRIAVPRDNAVDPQLGYRPYAGCLPF